MCDSGLEIKFDEYHESAGGFFIIIGLNGLNGF